MSSQRLLEFRYLREACITNVVRETGYSVQKSLQLNVDQLPSLKSAQAIQSLNEYVSCRNGLFPAVNFLFPTEDGEMFLPSKFKQNLRKLLYVAGQPITPSHPVKMSEQQIQAILNLKFQYQRPKFQQILAASLLGYQALRPGEVANLRKEDVDFDRGILTLTETKGQEVQYSPIHRDLLSPMKNYVGHLKQGESLFIRSSRKTWNRKDVYQAVQQLGDVFGVEKVNPRKLRSTVAHHMIYIGVKMNVISEVLRHKDKATAPRHYTPIFDIEVVRDAMNSLQFHSESDIQE